MKKELITTMPDGSRYACLIDDIAQHRAAYYAQEYGGSITRSLTEDTMPLFESDPFEIEDWAANNMNWEDVNAYIIERPNDERVDFQDGWVNGKKELR